MAEFFYKEKNIRQNLFKNQNTHFIFDNFFSKNLAFYEIMGKNMVQADRKETAT
jgi:hypothetical protein